MMAKPDISPTTIDLDEDQCDAIAVADRWTCNAYAELGRAYLEFADAEARLLNAKAKLVNCKGKALQADMARGNIVAAIAATMNLPPGEWTYDAEKGKLVREDTKNA